MLWRAQLQIDISRASPVRIEPLTRWDLKGLGFAADVAEQTAGVRS